MAKQLSAELVAAIPPAKAALKAIQAAEDALATAKEQASPAFAALVKAAGTGKFKLDGVVYQFRKVKNSDLTHAFEEGERSEPMSL